MVNMKFRNKNKANMGMGNSWSWVTCHLSMDCSLQSINVAFPSWFPLDIARSHERLTLSFLPALCFWILCYIKCSTRLVVLRQALCTVDCVYWYSWAKWPIQTWHRLCTIPCDGIPSLYEVVMGDVITGAKLLVQALNVEWESTGWTVEEGHGKEYSQSQGDGKGLGASGDCEVVLSLATRTWTVVEMPLGKTWLGRPRRWCQPMCTTMLTQSDSDL